MDTPLIESHVVEHATAPALQRMPSDMVLEAPVLQPMPSDMVLEARQTGGISLPKWAYTKEVVEWVWLLIERDRRQTSSIEVYEGFSEAAYRFVFAYKDQFKADAHKLQNLVTIKPGGQKEPEESLQHNEEAGLIAYTFCQTMEPAIAGQQRGVDPFVWSREDDTFAVVQTWPVEINKRFAECFETLHAPFPASVELKAKEEFEKAMFKLFQLDPNTPNLPFMVVKKVSKNENQYYVGKGEALMAMLRIFKSIRDDLDIVSIVEPDGIECRWKCETRTGTIILHMELTRDYCLYIKKGWDTMACVKEKVQFDKDCSPSGNRKRIIAKDAEVDMPYVMDLDWFAPVAYFWTLASAGFVWTCAFLMVTLRVFGTATGQDWVNQSAVLWVTTCIAGLFASWADFGAMRWCIVPWLQQVKRLAIMTKEVSFCTFLTVHLLSTFVQVITIQSNAWFMMNAAQTNDEVQELWTFLWMNSGFGCLPERTWTVVITPKWSAIVLWVLSTGQLILPLLTGVPWPPCQVSPFPTKKASRLRVVDTAPDTLELDGDRCAPTTSNQGKQPFVPRLFRHDFMTLWSTLSEQVFETWGFAVHRCTYRESVAKLSLASGLRYTGSISMSYPRQRINEIIKFKQGYTVRTKTGFDSLDQGWELRAIKEFQKLVRTHLNRVTFIMLYKLALQMNLQLTFIIIWRIQQRQKHPSEGDIVTSIDAVGFFSIMSLSLTFGMELFDLKDVVCIYYQLRKSVKDTAFELGKTSKVYAIHDFVVDEDKSNGKIVYSGKDLKSDYYTAMRSFWRMIWIAFFCVWLIGYALLKFLFAEWCENGAWSLWHGCLNPPT